MKNYKVCILAAGKNDRVSYAKNFHVGLLPIGTKSGISRIINMFPEEIEIIIAVGYNKNLIKDFIKIAHPNRKIRFIDVENFDNPGSGPGKTLLACKDYLQCPFILTSADTIISDNVPPPDKNWIAISSIPSENSENYCIAEVENNRVSKFYDKIDTPTLMKICKDYKTIFNNTFIGTAGIYDYSIFWGGLQRNQSLIRNELQVSNGLTELINKNLEVIHIFNWFNTGSEAGYSLANRYFQKNKIIMKPDEFIYFENGTVIKYFADPDLVKERILRAQKMKGIVPEITEISNNFYAYKYVKGNILPKINNLIIFKQFLNYCKETIWIKNDLNGEEEDYFKILCKKFYFDKTNIRLEKFLQENGINDQEDIINGEKIPKVKDLMKIIDWEVLFDGISVLYHGDLQPENILVCEKGFQLIDWRHNFAGDINQGDLYYDLAKLYHALIITHEVIRNNQFEVKINNNHINYDFMLKSNLLDYKEILEEFIQNEGYDLKKVKILTALIFLNIAPLHHNPYNKFLYYLGKSTLFKELKNSQMIKPN